MASPFVSGVSGSESRRGTLQGISVQTPLGKDAFVVTSFEYSEELGQLFELVVELESSTADIDPAALVGKQFTVSLELPNGGTRHFNAFMQRFTRASHGGPFTSYLAVGIPWFGMLEFAENCQIFENINCCELVEQVFGEFDFATYHLLSFCPKTRWEAHTQYRESTFNFMQRSLQEQGSYYFWTHDDQSHTLTLCDNISNHAVFLDCRSTEGSDAVYLLTPQPGVRVKICDDAAMAAWVADTRQHFRTEEEVFAAIGAPYCPPEHRFC
jgi:uncharacterized protein involved in type VI secretion and phage assembly